MGIQDRRAYCSASVSFARTFSNFASYIEISTLASRSLIPFQFWFEYEGCSKLLPHHPCQGAQFCSCFIHTIIYLFFFNFLLVWLIYGTTTYHQSKLICDLSVYLSKQGSDSSTRSLMRSFLLMTMRNNHIFELKYYVIDSDNS